MQSDGGAAGQAGGSADGCGDHPAASAAGRSGGNAGKRRGGRPPKQRTPGGGGNVRVQWTVPEELRRRLAVHCAFTQEDEHRTIARALENFLHRYGKGQELFGAKSPPADDPAEQPSNGATVQSTAPAADWRAALGAQVKARRSDRGERPDTPEDRQDRRAG